MGEQQFMDNIHKSYPLAKVVGYKSTAQLLAAITLCAETTVTQLTPVMS
ncbi:MULTISPECIES: hypothetical protein [Psychrobacter]|jgi:hypothetical protein|nr:MULTISPECIES: hypothetical protein [Psychrobacter]NRD69672.1 hypothetical protein [Psychrobacter okhotskensis]